MKSKYIISIIISLILLYIIYKLVFKEKFTSYYNNIDITLNDEVNIIINKILDDINIKFNIKLIMGHIDRVEKTIEENGTNYNINVFIYNTQKFITKKINFDITINNNNIILNNIKIGDSRKILIEERGGIASRGSIVYKPLVDMNSVRKYNTTILDYTNVEFKETENKNVDRTKTILPNNDINKVLYPIKIINNIWDCFGVSKISKVSKDHAVSKTNIAPKLYINNYTGESKKYHFLFDPSQDSSSRPIGVTGARG
jgi:hypothetical protein